MFENLKEKNLPTKTKSPTIHLTTKLYHLVCRTQTLTRPNSTILTATMLPKKATPARGRSPKKPKEKDEFEEFAENLTRVLLLYLQVSYDLNHCYRFHKGNRLP